MPCDVEYIFNCLVEVVAGVGLMVKVVQSLYRCSMGIVVPALAAMVHSNSVIGEEKKSFNQKVLVVYSKHRASSELRCST